MAAHRDAFDRGALDSRRAGHNFALNFDFDAVRESDYDAPVIPGGRAPEYLSLKPRILEIAQVQPLNNLRSHLPHVDWPSG